MPVTAALIALLVAAPAVAQSRRPPPGAGTLVERSPPTSRSPAASTRSPRPLRQVLEQKHADDIKLRLRRRRRRDQRLAHCQPRHQRNLVHRDRPRRDTYAGARDLPRPVQLRPGSAGRRTSTWPSAGRRDNPRAVYNYETTSCGPAASSLPRPRRPGYVENYEYLTKAEGAPRRRPGVPVGVPRPRRQQPHPDRRARLGGEALPPPAGWHRQLVQGHPVRHRDAPHGDRQRRRQGVVPTHRRAVHPRKPPQEGRRLRHAGGLLRPRGQEPRRAGRVRRRRGEHRRPARLGHVGRGEVRHEGQDRLRAHVGGPIPRRSTTSARCSTRRAARR